MSDPVSAWLCSGCGWLNRGIEGQHPGRHYLHRDGGAIWHIVDKKTGETVFEAHDRTDCDIWLSSVEPTDYDVIPAYCEGEWQPAYVFVGVRKPLWLASPINPGWFLEERRGG